ncbi:MAG: hypothetical protein DWQ29_04880, partial [Planctomycetota bacterium]
MQILATGIIPQLPGYELNPATWLYLSIVLIVAVFFRFNRVWSLRNFDLLLLLSASPALYALKNVASDGDGSTHAHYAFLFTITGLIFIRLMLDPVLRRRPHFGQNLNAQGSAFLCIAAFMLLTMEAIHTDPPPVTAESVERATDMILGTEHPAETSGDAAAGPVVPILCLPFNTVFQVDASAAKAVAILAHLVVICGLLLVGRNLFGDLQLGLGMATMYLLLPCTAYDVGEVHHVLPAALIVWAIVFYRQPLVSGVLLALACGMMFFPVFLVPLWAAYYGRRGGLRFAAALLLVGAVVFTIVAMTSPGPESVFRRTFGAIQIGELLSFNIPGPTAGFWTGDMNWYRFPVIVSFAIFLAALTFWPRRMQFEQLSAYSAAVIVATQFWYPVHGGAYMLWYLPLLLIVVFRPRLVYAQTQEAASQQSAKATSPGLSGPHAPRAKT